MDSPQGQAPLASADMAANRRSRKYTRGELLRRGLWSLVQPTFRFSPRCFFAWRRVLLRLFGARIGASVHIYGSAVITMPWNLDVGDWSAVGEGVLIYDLGPVSIGTRVTVSQRAHLCAGTHDHTRRDMPLIKPPIRIEDDAWICADAFIGPGVTVGAGAVVGARAVAVKDVPAWTVVVGNPARPVGPRLREGRWSE
jgi:putative colanic acid biosynthesis acetyltransferase WcaF